MTWNYVLMNPPYDKNLHLKFIKNVFEYISDTGKIICISPDNWLTNKYAKFEKSKIKRDFRENFSKNIDDVEIIPGGEFNKLFGTNNFFGVGIFTFSHNAKGIDPDSFIKKDDLLYKIIEKVQSFPSLRSQFKNREQNKDKKYFCPVRRTNHNYLSYAERDETKIKSIDGILFNSQEEKNNFIDSFDTWLYKYLSSTDWTEAQNSASVPFLKDYSTPWTNEKLYKLFNITDKEKKIIEKTINDNKENLW